MFIVSDLVVACGDQIYFHHGDGRFLGELGKVFNDFFQISRKTASPVWRGQPGLPLASKFEKNR